MQERHQFRRVGMRGDQVIIHVPRMAGCVANTVEAANFREMTHQLGERPLIPALNHWCGAVIGIDILAEQLNFAHALRCQVAGFQRDVIDRTR